MSTVTSYPRIMPCDCEHHKLPILRCENGMRLVRCGYCKRSAASADTMRDAIVKWNEQIAAARAAR